VKNENLRLVEMTYPLNNESICDYMRLLVFELIVNQRYPIIVLNIREHNPILVKCLLFLADLVFFLVK
ncbi:MAG: hypothetical protein ACK41O_26000, partial [Runella zeae]